VPVCAYCKTNETELHLNNIPISVTCADALPPLKAPATGSQARTRLLQDVLEWTARIQGAEKELEAAKKEGSSFPNSDGTQHVKNASHRLAAARSEYAKAHTRLARYFTTGKEPEEF
jgi:hypothetical protein